MKLKNCKPGVSVRFKKTAKCYSLVVNHNSFKIRGRKSYDTIALSDGYFCHHDGLKRA